MLSSKKNSMQLGESGASRSMHLSQGGNVSKGGLTRRQIDGIKGVMDVRKATMNEEGRFGTIVPGLGSTNVGK